MTAAPGQVSKTVILPPRPNLGPEPLPPPDEPAFGPLAWIAAIGLPALALFGWVLLRRRRKPAAPHEPGAIETTRADLGDAHPSSIVAAAEMARKLVAARLGPDWLARTTEELTADPAVARSLTAATRTRLEALLQAADRAKFAPGSGVAGDGQGWDELLSTLGEELSRSEPSATSSTTIGR
jgi:hypothetical protein